MKKKIKEIKKTAAALKIFVALMIWITIFTCISVYPETYEFWNQSISSLGHKISTNGLPNEAHMLFTIGLTIVGITLIIIAIIAIKKKDRAGIILIPSGIGAFLVGWISTNDNKLLHQFGAICFLYLMMLYVLVKFWKTENPALRGIAFGLVALGMIYLISDLQEADFKHILQKVFVFIDTLIFMSTALLKEQN